MIDRACISINAKCNLQCKYCHFGNKMNYQNAIKKEFSSVELDTIVNNITTYVEKHNLEKFKLGIVGSGEPMLNFDTVKQIVQKIAHHRTSNRFALYLITNGTIWSDEQMQFFYSYRHQISVNFSIDGPQHIHELIRTHFQETLENANKYRTVFGEMPLINCVITRQTLLHRQDVIRFFLENGFLRVNFSIVFGVEDSQWSISQQEYDNFLDEAKKAGLSTRQKRIDEDEIYDCAKYGRRCGVGITNIFIAKSGIYPCGRFLDLPQYAFASFDTSLDNIEQAINQYTPVPKGECYFEYHHLGENHR